MMIITAKAILLALLPALASACGLGGAQLAQRCAAEHDQRANILLGQRGEAESMRNSAAGVLSGKLAQRESKVADEKQISDALQAERRELRFVEAGGEQSEAILPGGIRAEEIRRLKSSPSEWKEVAPNARKDLLEGRINGLQKRQSQLTPQITLLTVEIDALNLQVGSYQRLYDTLHSEREKNLGMMRGGCYQTYCK